MSKQFYITTAIDYVNGHPHLGHAYEKIITDVIARGRRSLGEAAFFLTGNDEHGQKVQQAAATQGKDPQAYCDEFAQIWLPFAEKLHCSHDDFIRTTEPRHKAVVQAILSKLHQEGQFYRQTYSGWYSTKEETFLTEKDRREDGTFDPGWGEVVQLDEDNYYFKLGEHQQWLIDHINAHPEFIAPDYRRNEVLGFLKSSQLEDLCISRPKARLSWGIPLPFDPDYVTYVWFDALVNYVTVPAAKGDPVVLAALPDLPISDLPSPISELWPADAHVIGKDILKFHAVYWPIMLKAIGLPLPKQILAHGWWQKEGAKISKSTGNIVDPVEVINEWGVDAFRYYVVRELAIGPDGNWTDAGFQARYNAELANGLGNLLNRSLSMLQKYRGGKVPARHDEQAALTAQITSRLTGHLRDNSLQEGLKAIWELVTELNVYIQKTEPFRLAKDPAQATRLDEVLYNLAEGCRVLAVLLWPFLPSSAEKIYAQLNLSSQPDKLAAAAWGGLPEGHLCGAPQPLFPRKDLAK
jgi:methionyl-tRNA synthetase